MGRPSPPRIRIRAIPTYPRCAMICSANPDSWLLDRRPDGLAEDHPRSSLGITTRRLVEGAVGAAALASPSPPGRRGDRLNDPPDREGELRAVLTFLPPMIRVRPSPRKGRCERMRCRTEPWIEPACPGERASDPTSHGLRPCVLRSQGGGLACRPKTVGPPDAVAPGGAVRSSSSSTRSSSGSSFPAPASLCPTWLALPSSPPRMPTGTTRSRPAARSPTRVEPRSRPRSTWGSTRRTTRRSATCAVLLGEVTIPAGLAPGSPSRSPPR